MSKIKKGDNIIMLSGKDRGKRAKVLDVLLRENRIVVEGLNLVKRHLRARKQGQKGQVISKERPVSISSVALICKSCGLPTRVGYKIEGDLPAGRHGKKIRICKKCKGEV